ncbi:hypothetical protein GCM10023335_33840 [Streptomyces siamensis]|uniref:Uncharacterized protein n=1 Tax=Streptomyces siamensis TaxID=1274986 RepID=A0ABP9IYP7_9ACTN
MRAADDSVVAGPAPVADVSTPGRGTGCCRSGAVYGRTPPRRTHPALLKWRYASTVPEAHLRFNLVPSGRHP